MEIKKTAKGWEYDGIVFKDEHSAKLTKEVSESARPVENKAKPKAKDFELKYDGTKAYSFGKFIEAVLAQQNKSIVQLAAEFNVSRQTLFAWMNGESTPTLKNLSRIVAVTGCSGNDLKVALIDNFERQKQKVYAAIDQTIGAPR